MMITSAENYSSYDRINIPRTKVKLHLKRKHLRLGSSSSKILGLLEQTILNL